MIGDRGLRRWRIGQCDGLTKSILGLCPQHDLALLFMRLDAPCDFPLGDPRQHLCIRGWRFGAKIPVIRRQIAKIFRDRFHCIK